MKTVEELKSEWKQLQSSFWRYAEFGRGEMDVIQAFLDELDLLSAKIHSAGR